MSNSNVVGLERRPQRRFGSISDATEYCGMGRSKLYQTAAQHPGLMVKWGGKTLVNFAVLDQLLDGLPDAHISPSK